MFLGLWPSLVLPCAPCRSHIGKPLPAKACRGISLRLKAHAHPPPLLVAGCLNLTGGIGGAAPVNPCSRNPREGGVFFMVLLACAWCLRVFFLLFIVFSFLPSSWSGCLRPFRGCLAFFGCPSFAAALAFSLLPPAGGGLVHRLAVIIAFPFVDKICLYVDFICIFADIFVTLYYN